MAWVIALALLGIGLLLLPEPHELLGKADRYAYAVCHRIHSHSFSIEGRQLPLCARCSGTYLGAFAGVVVLLVRGRGRANRFPERRYVIAFALFIAAWAVDGLNSYLNLFSGQPFLYEPNNLLRLVTGTLEGLVLAAYVLPLFNTGVWAQDDVPCPVLASWPDLLWLLAGGVGVVGLVASGWEAALYPLALLSGAMVVGLVGVVCALVLLIVARRDGRARRWRQAAAPLFGGLVLALLALNGIGLARDFAAAWLRLPF